MRVERSKDISLGEKFVRRVKIMIFISFFVFLIWFCGYYENLLIFEDVCLRNHKFEELDGAEVLPHPAYSPDVAPSDYGLFRSMQHFMKGRRFESFDEVEEACEEFFDSKPKKPYFDQIRKLADRWQKVVDKDGLYFEE